MVADALLRQIRKFGAEAFVVACVQAEDVDDSLGVLEGDKLFFQKWRRWRAWEIGLKFD